MNAATGIQSFKVNGFRQAAPLREGQSLGLIQPHRRAPLAARVPYRPSQHRLPMISGAPKARMGGFWDDVSLTVGLGAGGLGAIMLSTILPRPFKTITQVGGIGLLAFAAINLLSSKAQGQEPSKGGSGVDPTQTPIAPVEVFSALTGAFDSPKLHTEVVASTFGGYYKTTVSITNPTKQPVAVKLKIIADENLSSGVFGFGAEKRLSDVVAQMNNVTIMPGTWTLPFEPQLLTYNAWTYWYGTWGITLKLRIERQVGMTGVENVRDLARVTFFAS